jgi:hypothetical protein
MSGNQRDLTSAKTSLLLYYCIAALLHTKRYNNFYKRQFRDFVANHVIHTVFTMVVTLIIFWHWFKRSIEKH